MTALTPQQMRELAQQLEKRCLPQIVQPDELARISASALRAAADQLVAVKMLTRNPEHTYSLNNVTEWDVKAGITRATVTPMFVERDALLAILTADTAPQEDRDE